MAQLDLPQVPNRPFFATVTTDAHIDVKVAATLAEMPVQEFIALNPAHNRPVIKPGFVAGHPGRKTGHFRQQPGSPRRGNKPLSTWQSYTLSRGEDLAKVARRFGMSVANLKKRPSMASSGKARAVPGQTLL